MLHVAGRVAGGGKCLWRRSDSKALIRLCPLTRCFGVCTSVFGAGAREKSSRPCSLFTTSTGQLIRPGSLCFWSWSGKRPLNSGAPSATTIAPGREGDAGTSDAERHRWPPVVVVVVVAVAVAVVLFYQTSQESVQRWRVSAQKMARLETVTKN
ncbi:unnamed protein product [Pleuronectes platessa]|uniref:Transmembrane protein n=1 Tax=Pleuronectes platessa TaxID=8262 RepID=A0A9N7Y9H9_PLEPL|nr:unnamed protein product [Pleuronectes platessa]